MSLVQFLMHQTLPLYVHKRDHMFSRITVRTNLGIFRKTVYYIVTLMVGKIDNALNIQKHPFL